MQVATRALIGAVGLTIGVAVSGCSSDGTVAVTPPSGSASATVTATTTQRSTEVPDAGTLVQEARTAYTSATSAHVHATINQSGDVQVIDIHGTMDGTNQELTIDDSDKGKATVRTVDGTHYIKGDEDFWTSASKSHDTTTAKLLAGKWVLAPGKSSEDFDKLTIRHLLDDMIGPSALSDSDTDQMRTYATTEQDTDLYAAVSTDPGQDVNTVKIVADDPHNVTQVAGKSLDGSSGTADFDGWDSQDKVTAPEDYITVPGSGDPTV